MEVVSQAPQSEHTQDIIEEIAQEILPRKIVVRLGAGREVELDDDGFDWDEQSLHALSLFADGLYTATDVAKATGAPYYRVLLWRKSPPFQAALGAFNEATAQRWADRAMASKDGRVRRTIERLELIQQIVEQRGASADPELAVLAGVEFNVDLAGGAGATTGLVTARRRQIGTGETAETVVDHELDTGLLAAEASLSRQVAMELGQWTEKSETTHIQKLYIGIDISQV